MREKWDESNILGNPKVHRVLLGILFPWTLPLLTLDLVTGRREGQSKKSLNNEMFPNYKAPSLPMAPMHAMCAHMGVGDWGGSALTERLQWPTSSTITIQFLRQAPHKLTEDKVSKDPKLLSKGLTGMATLDTLLELIPAYPRACIPPVLAQSMFRGGISAHRFSHDSKLL